MTKKTYEDFVNQRESRRRQIQMEADAELDSLATESAVLRQAVGAVRAASGGCIDLGADRVYMAHHELLTARERDLHDHQRSKRFIQKMENGGVTIEEYCAAARDAKVPEYGPTREEIKEKCSDQWYELCALEDRHGALAVVRKYGGRSL